MTSLFSVITANGLCYSSDFTVMSISVICIGFLFVLKFE